MLGRSLDHVFDDTVGECRLASAGAADHQDLVTLRHGRLDGGALPRRHNPLAFILVQREYDALWRSLQAIPVPQILQAQSDLARANARFG